MHSVIVAHIAQYVVVSAEHIAIAIRCGSEYDEYEECQIPETLVFGVGLKDHGVRIRIEMDTKE